MHFIDAWTSLPPLGLIRLLLPAAFLVLAVFVPGRGTARLAALGVALCLPLVRELEVPRSLLVVWVALWVLIAWQAGRVTAGARRSLTTRLAGMEPGTVGLRIGAALLVLLLAAVARQDLAPEESRRVAYAMLLIDLGLLHLMLRRHALGRHAARGGNAIDRARLAVGDRGPREQPGRHHGLPAHDPVEDLPVAAVEPVPLLEQVDQLDQHLPLVLGLEPERDGVGIEQLGQPHGGRTPRQQCEMAQGV